MSISDPSDLRTISTSPVQTQARDVAIGPIFFGDVFSPGTYVADDFFGIRVFTGDGELDSFASSDRGIDVATNGNEEYFRSLIALAAGETGVYLFDAPFFVANESDAAADAFALAAPFPNPVRGPAVFRYTLPERAEVTLAVYDVLGRRVVVLAEGSRGAGEHEARFETASLPNGVYVLRLRAGGRTATRRLTVVR